ncbi:Hypothetical protein D9617_30g011770 [Elsinoe fawcettii]|nr:Hypothetical protein D9617_30g011770 [Elsinoe fawcettii]
MANGVQRVIAANAILLVASTTACGVKLQRTARHHASMQKNDVVLLLALVTHNI